MRGARRRVDATPGSRPTLPLQPEAPLAPIAPSRLLRACLLAVVCWTSNAGHDAGAERLPARCEAVWRGPTAGCGLTGEWLAVGTGRTETDARKKAGVRLKEAIGILSQEAADRAATSIASAKTEEDRRLCARHVYESATFVCEDDADLATSRICYAEMPRGTCWQSSMITLEGEVWRMMELGQDLVCAEVERALVEQEASLAARQSCQAECRTSARVRCPS
jgi:hypothetical protein